MEQNTNSEQYELYNPFFNADALKLVVGRYRPQ